jgi:hypothetical protein
MQTSWRVGARPGRGRDRGRGEAGRTRGAAEIEPARFRAVLEPYAIAEILLYTAFDMFNGLALLEERSWFSGASASACSIRR